LGHVRFTPESGLKSDIVACPLSAKSGSERMQQIALLLDHLVGAGACNGGMIPRFHRAVCDYFTFGSAPVPAITRAEKPVLNDSKFSPSPFVIVRVSVRDSDPISRPASRKVSHIQAVERNP
jgi:hypothetical protein